MPSAEQERHARSVRGETLTEVLVAILISCLAILLMATVIAASFNINETSRKAMDDYYKKSNDIAGHVSGTFDGEGTVAITLSSGGTTITLENGSVGYYINEQLDDEAIVSFVAK